ncbi:flagellar basal-body rod protein FlgF [Glaciibacter psychrotolerans]|uniref:Flagellar hook protein FlgE n=1 Tax=Glaciibacter psychrotolerans TaxID=670054 RepID=A0A7Z0EC75_9MICO|nr:flagellar basal-body rod protein FlgF [Leifsonia psychrotolerans]NYJ18766.1 flagellar hook protein FlgE [Leifsonia psychrotolerans]
MLRSLYSGISGLRSHQTMLDVTGNNIANVNTVGFKSSAVQFQDTLSQVVKNGSGAGNQVGGTNPAQVGLGVQVAAVSTNFAQGSAQATGKPTDLMIAGDGFFLVQSGGETRYTRNGAFDFDSLGRLVTADGSFVQGRAAVNGQIPVGAAVGPITLPLQATVPAKTTTSAVVGGNLPGDAVTGTVLARDIDVYDATGNKTTLALTFTKTVAGWDVSDGTTTAGALTFTGGVLTGPSTFPVGGISVDMSAVTGSANLTTIAVNSQNGAAAGTLTSYSIASDGTVLGTFSNGETRSIAQIALATFANPGGLEKAGGSTYRVSVSSGNAVLGAAGDPGFGGMTNGYLEMSNVDLSQEFTNLIVAQRGFQANARIITTSDEVLQELTNLKR